MPALQRANELLLALACLATCASGAVDGAEPILSGLSASHGSNVTVWAVPLRDGPLLPLDYVATCERLGMKPVCEGGPDCEWADDVCVALQIEEASCGHPLRGLQQHLAASSHGGQPSIEGLCNYEGMRGGGWASGVCLAAGGRGYVSGNHAAGTRRVACAGPIGAVAEAGFSRQAGRCIVDGDCVSSPSRLGASDSLLDGSGCLIVALNPGTLKVQYFQTSSDDDVLTIRGKPYSGDNPPNGLSVHAGDVLAWTTEGILLGDTGSEWKICLERQTAGYNDKVADEKVQKLAQEVKQDHAQEAVLQHDLEVAQAKAKAEEKASASASRQGQLATQEKKEEVQKLNQEVQKLEQEVSQDHAQEGALRHDLEAARARAAAEEEEKTSANTSSQALLIKKELEVQKLNQEVKQDRAQEAALRHDLEAAQAKAAVAQAKAAVAQAKAAAEEKSTASTSSQGHVVKEGQEAEAHLQREEAQLQGSLFTDVMVFAVTFIILVLLLAVCAAGALLVAQRRGRFPWRQDAKGPLAKPLLGDAAESTASGERSTSVAPLGERSGAGFEPRVSVVDYFRNDGTRAKCVRVEAPGCHMVTGCRTIHGSVKELGGTGVHLRLVKEHDLPEDLNYLESGFARDAAGIWEKTLNFEDGPWQVQEGDLQSGGAVDLHGIWQVHLVRSLPSRSFAVCPHVDMSAADCGLEVEESDGNSRDLRDDDASSLAASYGEALDEAACSFVDPNMDTGSSTATSVQGGPVGLGGGRPDSLQEGADGASLSNDLLAREKEAPALSKHVGKDLFEQPVTVGLSKSRSGSSLTGQTSVLVAGSWHVVSSSK